MVSLGTVVLNSRDQQRKLWLPKVTQHNLVIIVTQYSSHRSTGTVLGVKKVRGQSEAALQIRRYVQPKTLISVEAKKLLIKNLFHYLNDIQ